LFTTTTFCLLLLLPLAGLGLFVDGDGKDLGDEY
jgi:hypothetical protein